MAVKKECVCGHGLGDHRLGQVHFERVRQGCLWNDCNCRQYIYTKSVYIGREHTKSKRTKSVPMLSMGNLNAQGKPHFK